MPELHFSLAQEDDWPPVASECLPAEGEQGGFRLLATPLFVKELSLGDIIRPTTDAGGHVISWTYVARSGHTTVWLLRLAASDQIPTALERLRELGCGTSSLDRLGCHAVDVPPSVPIESVDAVLALLDPALVGVAFPSFRHRDGGVEPSSP